MSIFKPNLDKFSSTIFIAPPNEYEVEVASAKYRAVDIKNGKRAGEKMHIVAFGTRIIADAAGDAEFAGKLLNVDFIVGDDEASFDRLLRFVMCCKGIRPGTAEADEEFRQNFGDLDLSVDTENGTIGSAYTDLVRSRLIVNVDIRTQGDKQYQNYRGCRPF